MQIIVQHLSPRQHNELAQKILSSLQHIPYEQCIASIYIHFHKLRSEKGLAQH
jgi:hypothetical protein